MIVALGLQSSRLLGVGVEMLDKVANVRVMSIRLETEAVLERARVGDDEI